MRPILWTRLLLLALLIVPLSAGAAGAQSLTGASGDKMAPGLRAQAAAEGGVGVIVELAQPFSPEGLLGRAAREGQRARISGAGEALLQRLGPRARAKRRFRTIPFVALEVGPEGLAELERSPGVRSVQADPWLRPLLSDSLPRIRADIVHTGYDGSGSAVVVVDSGVDSAHEFLAGKTIPAAEACFSSGGDCPNGQTSQYGAGAATYCTFAANGCSHGTHVAGIAVGNDGAGRVGTAPGADLIPIQVSSESNNAVQCAPTGELPCALTQTSDLIEALEHAYDLRNSYDIAAVNVSLGGGQWSNQALCDAQNAATKAAIDNLLAVGIPTAIAAGNSSFDDALTAPACISSAVAVGGATDNGSVVGWTNWAPFLDLLAPGATVESSVPFALKGKSYKFLTGTSMSTPHVAGAFALLRQALPGLSSQQLLASMIATGPLLTHGPTGQSKPQLDVLSVVDAYLDTCDNGIDDDGDGFFDHPDDTGCAAPTDGDELGFQACDNGADDDGDGLKDYPDDPGCALPASLDESPSCDDDVDNDGDGKIDWDGGSGGGTPDPQCGSGAGHSEGMNCGLGFEAGLALVALYWLRRRRSHGRGPLGA